MKLYKNLFATGLLAASMLTVTSCNDFLEMEPPSNVTPESYFQNADQLGAYAISQYQSLFTSHSGWGFGNQVNGDGGTDNMVGQSANTSRFTANLWQVSQTGDLGLGLIRYCNYFFETVLPRNEAGGYSANQALANHYIGEMYFIRAWVYFSRLQTYGDYPIVTEVLEDNTDDLIAHGKRMPRNEVADFIIQDLDRAIPLLYNQGEGGFANNRINKQVAQLVKSRVALYEATYEKYHRGTGRVPGDEGWPGERVHPNYTLDVDAHVNQLLTTAMEAAKEVADRITLTENTMVLDQNPASYTTGWNPYFEMFASTDLSNISEVLMWRAYGTVGSTNAVHGLSSYIPTGGATGFLRGYMENFLMANGLPIYATGSGYHGDESIDNVKADRDGRLQLFVFGESNYIPFTDQNQSNVFKFTPVLVATRGGEMGDPTGYRPRKGESFVAAQNTYGKQGSTTGCIIFRGVEAMLNYMEAKYERDGNLDDTAINYWRQIRERAHVNTDYQATINATDMNEEAQRDWGAYSRGQILSDPTLYNIRRERRCEFIAEGMRWADLVRWRSLDQLKTTPYIPEGVNYWTSMYETAIYDEIHNEAPTRVEGPTAENANISSSQESVYIRPYRIRDNNDVFDGYTWMNAHYNSPLPVREIQLLSPDENVSTSVLYQTWGWPTQASMPAEE